MSKKVISILLSAAMLVAMFCVGFGAVTAAADDTRTYYFLAPDNYCKTEAGAANTDVGAYWWSPEENAPWPGQTMTAAPEIGENIYKIEGVPAKTTALVFNAFVDAGTPQDPKLAAVAHQTKDVNLEGYDASEEECPYDGSVDTANFDGWVFVLNLNEKGVNELSGAETAGGAWFTVDNYKSSETYYGSYGFAAEEPASDTEPAADTDTTPVAPVADDEVWHAGDTVTVEVQFGGINGEATKIGAYNYDVTYNTAVVELADKENLTTGEGATTMANTAVAGTVKIGNIAPFGLEQDFTGDKTTAYKLTFNVTKDTTKSEAAIAGVCSSLSAMTADASKTEKLIGAGSTEDNYSNLLVKVACPHQPEEPSSSEPEKPSSSEPSSSEPSSSTPSSSKPASSSSQTSSKSTGDNASKSTSSAKGTTASTAGTSTATVQTAGTFAVVSLVVILMAAAAVVLYTRKKTEE